MPNDPIASDSPWNIFLLISASQTINQLPLGTFPLLIHKLITHINQERPKRRKLNKFAEKSWWFKVKNSSTLAHWDLIEFICSRFFLWKNDKFLQLHKKKQFLRSPIFMRNYSFVLEIYFDVFALEVCSQHVNGREIELDAPNLFCRHHCETLFMNEWIFLTFRCHQKQSQLDRTCLIVTGVKALIWWLGLKPCWSKMFWAVTN